MTDPLFCIIIPMYNEALNAEKCVFEISKALSYYNNDARLIIVEDGSLDNTKEILISLCENNLFSLVINPQNLGYGKALMNGVREAIRLNSKYVLFMDSDLTNSPSDIPKFVEYMLQDYDIIKATRYSHGGCAQGVPFHRYLISFVGNKFLRLLIKTEITDVTNGFRAIKVELLKNLNLVENRFAIITEEFCKIYTHKIRVVNIGVVLTNRDKAIRSTSFVYNPSVFWQYFKYPLIFFLNRSVDDW